MTLEAVGMQEEKESERRLPIPVAVLLVAAIVDAWLIASWQAGINSFPFAIPRLVLHVAEYASDFLIAAALMGGSRRWSGGRRWFVAAAALFALHGVLALARVEWLAWLTQGNLVVTDQLQAQLSALALAVALLGLWAPARGRGRDVARLDRDRSGSGLRAWLIVVIGGRGRAGDGSAPGVRAVPSVPAPNEYLVPLVSAVRGRGIDDHALGAGPGRAGDDAARGGIGNLLIAGGIGVALVATGWEQWIQSQGPQDLPPRFFDLVSYGARRGRGDRDARDGRRGRRRAPPGQRDPRRARGRRCAGGRTATPACEAPMAGWHSSGCTGSCRARTTSARTPPTRSSCTGTKSRRGSGRCGSRTVSSASCRTKGSRCSTPGSRWGRWCSRTTRRRAPERAGSSARLALPP